jgi:hypothetical protein
MKQIAKAPLALAALLALSAALSGCGHSDNADAVASSDNVEMPAEEAMSGVAATPAADPLATATAGADNTGTGSAAPTTAPSAAATAATSGTN